MSRRLQPRHMAIEPGRTFDSYPDDCLDGWSDLEDAKRAYFRPGDVVAIETAHGPRRAIVLFVSREYSPRLDEWIPLYKVRVYRADGTPGRAWRWAWPGTIQRGLEALAAA